MAVQTNTFKGARYVPLFEGEWSAEKDYEAITSVQYQGFTYLSKQPVPAGVSLNNTEFWLLWADPNAQMEQLRQLVEQYAGDVEDLDTAVSQWAEQLENEITAREQADAILKNAIGNTANLESNFNADEHTTSGSHAFDISSAAKCRYGNDVYYSYITETPPQNRILILPFNAAIIGDSNETAVLQVFEMPNSTIKQELALNDGKRFVRYRENETWSPWSPTNYGGETIQPASVQVLNTMYHVAQSYVELPITYQHWGANWYTNSEHATNVATENPGLDCSGFLEMVSLGVPYEYSRFNLNNNDNVRGAAGYIFDVYNANENLRKNNAIAFTNEKAEWCRDNGFGFYPNADLSNLKPGDWFFWADSEIDNPNRWLNISHCGIFLGFMGDSSYSNDFALTIEVSGGPGTAKAAQFYGRQVSTFMQGVVYCARVPYGITAKNTNVKPAHKEIVSCNYIGSTLKNLFIEPYHENESITIEFDGMITTTGNHFTISLINESGSSVAASTTPNITNDTAVNKFKHYVIRLRTTRTNVENVHGISIYSGDSNAMVRNAVVYDEFSLDNTDAIYSIVTTSTILDYVTSMINTRKSDHAIAYNSATLDYFGTARFWDVSFKIKKSDGNGIVLFTSMDATNIRAVIVTVSNFVATAIEFKQASWD